MLFYYLYLYEIVTINECNFLQDKNTGITTNTTLEVIYVEPGKRYRVRIINAFCTVCPGMITIQDHNLTVIATDGRDIKPKTVDSITSFAGTSCLSFPSFHYNFIIG